MIKIVTKIDSVESGGVQFGCKWETSEKVTKEEEQTFNLLIKRIKESFDEIQTVALLNGGSVERLNKKGNNGER